MKTVMSSQSTNRFSIGGRSKVKTCLLTPVNQNKTAVDNNESFSDTELDPLKSEVEWAIKSLKDRKSPGCDEITAEMIKASGIARITYYHEICMKIWNTGEWPEEWKRAVFIILPKK